MPSIFHITTPAAWADAQSSGGYEHPSLAAEGFIHLSTADQLLPTTERHYAGVGGLILLEVNPDAVPDLRWELAPSVGEDFPHSYTPIPVDAVVATHPWDDDADRRTQVMAAIRSSS